MFSKSKSADKWNGVFTGRMSFHPTISVKALKGTQSTNPIQWPGLILSSSSTRLLTEWVMLLSCRLSDAISNLFQHFTKIQPRVDTDRQTERKHKGKRKEVEAKDVLPNINCMQAAKRAEKCRFYP